MDVEYTFDGVDFIWDGDKAESNFVKHHIELEEACDVFFDNFCQILRDPMSDDEERHHIIGYSFKYHLLLVVYVERFDKTRVISARNATRL